MRARLRCYELGRRTALPSALKGFNYRLPSIQAAILRVKLRRLERWTEARRARAADTIDCSRKLRRQRTRKRLPDGRHVYCLYTIRAAERDGLQKGLEAAGNPDGGSLSPPDSPYACLCRLAL